MMQVRSSKAIFIALILACTQGCAGLGEETGESGIASDAIPLLSTNNLLPNRITPNALDPNALNPSTLAGIALSPSTLDPQNDAAIHEAGSMGDISRTFLQYTVGCALDSSQSFSFSWRDGTNTVHQETFVGLLGLATGWASGPIGESEQRWVSACLAARTNYYGFVVNISVRGPHSAIDRLENGERTNYPNEEGAFWGNLFALSPYVRSCDRSANDVNSRANERECAAGHVALDGSLDDCGIIQRKGACSSICDPLASQDLYHLSCLDDGLTPPAASREIITVFLP